MKMNRLKRHTAMMILAGAALLAGCAYDDTTRALREYGAGSDSLAIEFGNGLIDNPVTTKGVTLLSDHSSTMGVWGWQTKDGNVGCLFRNQEVTFNTHLGDWTYSPMKYWDTRSSYKFYAYAPHAASAPGATVSIDDETGRISISGVTLKGSNTMADSAQARPQGNFGHVDDIDWMIDRTGQTVPVRQIHSKVIFNLQHTLVKFNVMIKARGDITESNAQLIIDSLSVGSFLSKGDFVQILDHSPVAGSEADDTIAEWTVHAASPRYRLQSTRGVQLTADELCIIESLLLPQDVADQTVQIHYTLRSENGRAERFFYRFNLNEAFSTLKYAHNYTLYIGIGLNVITFDSGTTQWVNETDKYQRIN